MTSSQYIIRYINNQPVCSDVFVLHAVEPSKKNAARLSNEILQFFSIIFEMSTSFSIKNLPTCAGKYVENWGKLIEI